MRRRARPLAAAVVAACVAVGAATPASPPRRSSRSSTKALAAPSLSLARTSALAVDLSTGTVLFAHNPSLPVAPASNEKLPVSWAALTQLGAGYRFHTEVYGVGSAGRAELGRRPRAQGLRRPDADDGRPRPARGDDPRARDPLGDGTDPSGTSRSTTRSAAPPAGSRTSSGSRRPRCRPSSSTARGAGRRSRRRSSPPARFRDALVRRGVTVARPARPRRRARRRRVSLASDVSDPLARIVAAHESRERQLLRRDAAQAARRGGGQGRHVGRRRPARRRGDAGRRDPGRRASGSSTARASRASTASRRRRSSA